MRRKLELIFKLSLLKESFNNFMSNQDIFKLKNSCMLKNLKELEKKTIVDSLNLTVNMKNGQYLKTDIN